MRICIALHSCENLGGLINHTEQLMYGLAELGHQVDLREMVWRDRAPSQRKQGCNQKSQQGIMLSQNTGWNFPERMRIPYKGKRLSSAIAKLEQYDLVIWTVPVPPKNKDNIGNADWLSLHELRRPRQLLFSHDGNAVNLYPHLHVLTDKVHALACVHHCALNTCSEFAIPRALVLNPQERPVRDVAGRSERARGFMSAQTFKGWKRVPELVGAIRYLPPAQGDWRYLIGFGIDHGYLTSVDKCKYYHADGKRYWEEAIRNGMVHYPHQPYEHIETMMQRASVVVDPSWSTRYGAAGGHFNRVVVEAMINGAIPVARKLGMGTELFTAGEHYIEIPQDSSLEEYAEALHQAGHHCEQTWQRFRNANVALLPQFERATVAKGLLALAFHTRGDIVVGETSERVVSKGNDILKNHYGVAM